MKICRTAIMALLAVAFAQTQTLQYEYEPNVDFSKLKTFSWFPMESIPIAAGRPEISPKQADAEIRAAVEKELASKGFRKAEVGGADFQVAYHGIVRARVEAEKPLYGQSQKFSGGRVVREGKLTIDIVESQENVLVWRGWSVNQIEAVGEESRAAIREGVHRILQHFPPPK